MIRIDLRIVTSPLSPIIPEATNVMTASNTQFLTAISTEGTFTFRQMTRSWRMWRQVKLFELLLNCPNQGGCHCLEAKQDTHKDNTPYSYRCTLSLFILIEVSMHVDYIV